MADLPITLYQLPASQVPSIAIQDGNILFETDQGNNGKIFLDVSGDRLQVGGNILPSYTVDFPSSGWSSTAPFTQTVTVTGMNSTDNSLPSLNVTSATSEANRRNMQIQYNYLWYFDIGNNQITATAKFTKPTMNLTIDFKGR